MIWVFVGAVVAGIWLFLVITYVTGDLKRMFCGHHSTTRITYPLRENAENGVRVAQEYWVCHNCGKTRGEKPSDQSA